MDSAQEGIYFTSESVAADNSGEAVKQAAKCLALAIANSLQTRVVLGWFGDNSPFESALTFTGRSDVGMS